MEIFNLVWITILSLMAFIAIVGALIYTNEWDIRFLKWSHDFKQKRRAKKIAKLKFKWEQLKKDKD